MITRVEVKNYKCLADVAVDLTPLHAVVGPNDSGKTSFLEAVAALVNVHELGARAFPPAWSGPELVCADTGETTVTLCAEVALRPNSASAGRFTQEIVFPESGQDITVSETPPDGGKLMRARGPALLFSFDASELGCPSTQIAADVFPMDRRGRGLPNLVDEILGRSRAHFDAMEQEFCGLFPRYSRIVIEPADAVHKVVRDDGQVEHRILPGGKGLRFVSGDDGLQVGAAHVSSGVLIALAILALKHHPTRRPGFVLFEEPENSIHPGLLGDIVRILREIVPSERKNLLGPQVILASHSPYLLDHLEPEEVTVFARDDDGAVRTLRMSDSERVRHLLKHFHLGEVWTIEGEQKLMAMGAEAAAP